MYIDLKNYNPLFKKIMNVSKLVNEVPSNYGKCILDKCSASSKCLRYQLYAHRVAAEKQFVIVNPDVAAPSRGEECPCFHNAEPVRLARGFQTALSSVPHGNVKLIQEELISYYSRSMFYYYRKGERALSPKEQLHISDVLIRHGAQSPVVFDAYEDGYVWNED